MTAPFFHIRADGPVRPLVGVLCCNEVAERPIQAVASRFIAPLRTLSGAAVMLVPALPDMLDIEALAMRLDGLLLTGSRSNVAPSRYGRASDPATLPDERRDAVALALSARLIERGRPVFGICRGLQELNVLFGGTLRTDLSHHQRPDAEGPYSSLFDHDHDVMLTDTGLLATRIPQRRITVNSVHQQGVDRLGAGLDVEARAADDGLIEAFSASPCGAPVLGVQWHPEWDVETRSESRSYFELFGAAIRGELLVAEQRAGHPHRGRQDRA